MFREYQFSKKVTKNIILKKNYEVHKKFCEFTPIPQEIKIKKGFENPLFLNDNKVVLKLKVSFDFKNCFVESFIAIGNSYW